MALAMLRHFRGHGLKGSIGVSAARAVGVVIGLLTSVVLARGLGEVARGEFAVITAWASVIMQVALLGLSSSLPYFVALHPQWAGDLLKRSVRISVGAWVVVGGALVIARIIGVGTTLQQVGVAGMLAILAVALSTMLLLLTQSAALGLTKISLFAWSDVTARVLAGLSLLVLFGFGIRSAESAAWAVAVGTVVVAVAVSAFIGGSNAARGARIPIAVTTELRYGFRAWVACSLAAFVTRIVLIALASGNDSATVADFAIALGVAETLAAVASSISQSRIAFMTGAVRSGAGVRREVVRTCALIGAITVPTAACVYFTAPVVIPYVYGVGYSQASDALRVMIPWLVALPLASVFQTMLAAQGMPWLSALAPLSSVVTVLVVVVAGYPLGIEGSAWAVSAGGLTFLLGAVAGCIIQRKHSRPMMEQSSQPWTDDSDSLQSVQTMPPENVYGSRSRIRWVYDQIKPHCNVAEFGCGTGLMLTAPLRRLGVRITGWDLHKPSIDAGRLHLSANGEDPEFLICGNFATVVDGSLDAVVASEVFEHIGAQELKRMLAVIRTKLRSDGQLLVTVPNGFGWFEFDQWVFRKLVQPLDRHMGFVRLIHGVKQFLFGDSIVPAYPSTLADDVCPHVQWFTKSEIVRQIEVAGFRVVSFHGSTLMSGPLADLFLTGVPIAMALNRAAGQFAGRFASGFRLVAILDGGRAA